MKLEINITEGHSDCETCGWWSWVEGEALLDGVKIAEVSGDDHLGGYPSRADEAHQLLLEKVLAHVGITYDGPNTDYQQDI